MATISGDVQYTQNGTVTNPCYRPRKKRGFTLLPMNEVRWPGTALPMRFERFCGALQHGFWVVQRGVRGDLLGKSWKKYKNKLTVCY